MKAGATESEIMEAIWLAADRRAGASYAQSTLDIKVMRQQAERKGVEHGEHR
jgi:hypothetical protein